MNPRTQIVIYFIVFLFNPTYAQWEKVKSNTNIRLVDICFINKKIGFCVGSDDEYGNGSKKGIILKSHDGGLNWSKVYEDTLLSVNDVVVLNSIIYCFGKKNGIPVGIISKDNGETWEIIYQIFGKSIYIANVQVSNSNIYFQSGSNLVKVENDSAKVLLSHIVLYDIDKSNKIVALNDQVTEVNESKDEGNTWNLIPVNNHGRMSGNSMTFASMKSNGDSISVFGTYPSILLTTQNGGKDWEFREFRAFRSFFLSSNVIYTYDSKNLYKTKDGGVTFQIESTEVGAIERIYSFNKVGFICGPNGLIMRNTHVN